MLKNVERSAGRCAFIYKMGAREGTGGKGGLGYRSHKSYGSYASSRSTPLLCNIPSDKAGVIKLARLARAFV